MEPASESEELLPDDQGVFDDFTVVSSWERLISNIEAACRKWQTGLAHDYLAAIGKIVDGHGKLHHVHCDLNYGSKKYQLDFYFDTDGGPGIVVNEWQIERHHLQLWFGVQEFLVLMPISMSGVILDASEATLLLSAVSVALSNCGSVWPAFVPVHDPTRKAYKGVQGMGGPYCRSFEADRIGSQVPIKLMHLEGLYELFISKLAFSLPDSAFEYDGKIRSTVRLTYRTPMPGFEIVSTEDAISPSAKPDENFDGNLSKVQWDDEYPWAEWYSVDDPIKGFELIATWSNKLVESSLDMAEFENVSTFEAEKWLLVPVITHSSEETLGTSHVSFASRMCNLLEAFSISREAKFVEDFCIGDSPLVKRITSSTTIPPQRVLDRVLHSLLSEGPAAPRMDDLSKDHHIAQGIKGARTNSLFAQFCLHALWFGNCNICAIAILWVEFVREVRCCWEEIQPLPRMLEEENPSFGTCLVHQKLQLLAACIRRKAEDQQAHFKTSVDECLINNTTNKKGNHEENNTRNKALQKEGKGSDQHEDTMLLLKTPEKMHLPITQKPPIMTEDMLLEREHALMVLSDSPSGKMTRAKLQTSMLSSDMAAFKAANPNAVFEDFIRWHSPRDWLEEEVFQDSLENLTPSDSTLKLDNQQWPPRGKLSDRMSHPDNLWFQLWRSIEPLPVDKQKPLFDHTREGEKVIHYLETLRPYQLLAQIICTGFSSVADLLQKTEIFKPKVLQLEFEQLHATITSTLKPLKEINLSDEDVAENMDDWHTDILELSSLLERAEKHVILAASLYQKLPDAASLISNLYSNYIQLEKQRSPLHEVRFQHAVNQSERVSVANLFPPVSLNQTQSRSLRMGNFLNGHEPISREIIFSQFDHYSDGQRERYRIDGSSQWENILSHRMYIQGSANDLQVAHSVVTND